MNRNHLIGVVLALILTSILSSLTPSHAQVPSIRIGDTAPEIRLEKLLQAPPDAQTNATSLKGKVVVLEFWATWCLPCVPAMKHLNQVAAKFKDKPVQFIAITDEADESLVTKFLNEQPIQGWVGLDTDGSVFSAYKPGGRPHTVLVDRNWKIAAITYADKVTAAVLDDLLAGKQVSLPLKPLGDSTGVDLAKTGAELFQVTIQPSTGSGPLYGAMLNAPGRIESDGLPLLPAIVMAYQTSNYRIVESVPLPKDFYKFRVFVPKGREELAYPVFQQALEVTFGLKIRREQREVDVFVLRPGSTKSASLNPSQASVSTERNDKGFIRAKKQPIRKLADLLEAMFLKAPVVDETGLTAEYDWELPYNRASNNLLLDAIRSQLGLEVVAAKRRIEFLVIERVGPSTINTRNP